MELLSPAGSFESLIAAVQSGADAVYLGGTKFGARQSAANFDLIEMKKWVDYCHIYGVKVYVTVNTLVKESEISELAAYVRELDRISVDGVIVQDFGVLTVIRDVAPELQIHASTQMTVTTLDDVKFLEKQGIKRIVLSRELSLDQIRHICRNTDCEIEVFVHGALCMSYSGQCLMSSILGGRSGNRGRCAQPCRLPYSLVGSGEVKKGFLLSPKDLCLVNYLKELKKSGVASLKIEGRLKRAGYVSAVVGVYRRCIDEERKATAAEMKELSNAFGRGFTSGFFGGEKGLKMMNLDNSSNAADNIFTKEALQRCKENADFRKIGIKIKAESRLNTPLVVTVTDEDKNTVSVSGDVLCQRAEKTPTTLKKLEESLLKLGGTPYKCTEISACVDDGIIIPVSAINAVRRDFCVLLNEKRVTRKKTVQYDLVDKLINKKKYNPQIICEVSTKEQFEAAVEMGINNIISPAGMGGSIVKISDASKVNLKDNTSVFVSAVGEFERYAQNDFFGSCRLNITNSYSADFYSDFVKRSLLSPELSLKEVECITKSTELLCGIVAYGRYELMHCANCPIKAAGKCQSGKRIYSLKDRKGEIFPVSCSHNCSVKILNSKPVYMADKWKDIQNSGVEFVVISFTIESQAQCKKIIRDYIDASRGVKIPPLKENTFTRGHFYRGVL